MAQYRVLTKSYINDSIVEEGEVIEHDGKPGSNLELVQDEAKASAKAKKPAAVPADADKGE